MLAFFYSNLEFWLRNPFTLLLLAFQIWMLVDAIRRDEWMWVVFLIIFPVINAVLYYFLVYRNAPDTGKRFDLFGSGDSKRIKDLEQKILHLDKGHHYFELGDIYFRKGKYEKALENYRAAREREPEDADINAHLGQCLLKLDRAADARELLENVCVEDPSHDYGETLMALGDCLIQLKEINSAIQIWQRVVGSHSYARAKVRLAELYIESGEPKKAKPLVDDVIREESHTPDFQRRQEAEWIGRAKRMQRQLAAMKDV